MFSGKSGKENGDTIVLNISLFTSKGRVTLSTRLGLNIFLVGASDPFQSIHSIHAVAILVSKRGLSGRAATASQIVHLCKTQSAGIGTYSFNIYNQDQKSLDHLSFFSSIPQFTALELSFLSIVRWNCYRKPLSQK